MKLYTPKHGSNGCLTVIGIAAAAIAAISIVSCGGFSEANSYNTPDSQMSNVTVHFTRIHTPQNYPTVIRGCLGGDGIYEVQDATSSPFVVRDDPACVKP